MPEVSKEILNDYRLAENAEFSESNFTKAANLYNDALTNAIGEDSVLILNRIARCYFHNHEYEQALNEYKQLLNFIDSNYKLGDVPPPAAALSQMADIYFSTNQHQKYFETILTLYKWLIDNPWDLSDGSYFYYVKNVSSELEAIISNHNLNDSTKQIINNLKELELKIYRQVYFINSIHKNIFSKINFSLQNTFSNKLQLHQLLYFQNDTVHQAGYYFINNLSQSREPLLFGFILNKYYIINNLLPEILDGIDLGNNNSVGLLNEKDSVIYIRDKLINQKYFIYGNFLKIFTNWKIALFNRDGKTLEELSNQERQQSFLLFGLTILVMLLGIVVIITTTLHEHQVSQMKSNFVSNVSHELKTPLSLVRMFSETLESGIVTDKNKQQEFYGIIKRESERLTNMINNLLDFSKIESRKKEFNFEQDDVGEVVKNIIGLYKPQILVEGFKIEINIPEIDMTAYIDKEAISRAVLNLLTNAVKYSNESKYILVEMSKSRNSIFISVIDHGIGISKKDIKNIFEYFYRGSTAMTNQVKGTGLGLTITKYIIEAHKGSISVESEINRGSKFTITIPCEG